MSNFKVGDSVIVTDNTIDPTTGLSYAGWQGRVFAIQEDGNIVVDWDSQTLEAMPQHIIDNAIANNDFFFIRTVASHHLQATKARDKKKDVDSTLATIYAAYGIEYKSEFEEQVESILTGLPIIINVDDYDDDDLERFDLEQFFIEQKIPQNEQAHVTQALAQGLETYYEYIYGYAKYGREPEWLIAERMYVPFIFGFGTNAVVRHKKISEPTKLKIVDYTFSIADPLADQGLPYGLMQLCSYLAQIGSLNVALLTFVAINLQMDDGFRRQAWADSLTKKDVMPLFKWLFAQELADDQLLWWIDYFARALETTSSVGRPLIKFVLEGERLSAETKRTLCWDWLADKKQIGTPPLKWQILQAQANGDKPLLKQLLTQANAPQEAIDQMLLAFDEMENAQTDIEEFFMMSPLLGFQDSGFSVRFIPRYAKRLAIPTLIKCGEDAWSVCDLFLRKHEHDYENAALQQGVADAIQQYSDQLSAEQIKILIERGLKIGQVPVRKQFYKLSTQFYGTHYLQNSLTDNAASLRKWGKKEMAKHQ